MPAIVAWIIQALLWVFRTRVGTLILSVLVWAGISYGTVHVVLQPAMTALNNTLSAASSASGLGAVMYQWIQVLHFPGALAMVVSAYASKAALTAGKLALFKRAA